MKATPSLICKDDQRRDRVWNSKFFGLDYLEVSPDQLRLTVYFLGRAPQDISPANVKIEGGERITGIQVTGVEVRRAEDLSLDDSMIVRVDRPGDFSTYRLCLKALNQRGRPSGSAMAGFDSRYACVDFSFKGGCPSDLDCNAPVICPPPRRTAPEINYLAKDYASFRQLIFDRLAVIMPGWQERHVPDVGVALVEILAYVGDHLSYYQDSVATEAYLETSRQRISVRRHARLVDYFMHEGCNARAWICVQPSADFLLKPSDTWFLAGLNQISALKNKTLLNPDDLRGLSAETYEVFEPLLSDLSEPIQLRAAHNEIAIYTWGDRQCCLPAGSTSAVLVDAWAGPSQPAPTDDRPDRDQPGTSNGPPIRRESASSDGATGQRKLTLRPGDVIFFEEVKGPITNNPADADPARRWAVRLIRVTPLTDPLIKTADGRPTPLVEVEWSPADAFPFPFCLSARLPAPDCRIITDVSVVRGNVILVDHGQRLRPPEDLGTVERIGHTGECACEGSIIEMTATAGVFRPQLQRSPLTFRTTVDASRPASQMLTQDPRAALPAISLQCILPAPDGSSALFKPEDLQKTEALAAKLRGRDTPAEQLLHSRLSPGTKLQLKNWNGQGMPPADLLSELIADLTASLETWSPQRDLLSSGSVDSHFVVEMDDDRVAHLRFGDGVCGRRPDAGAQFLASYRIGNGVAGNVSAEQINKLLFRDSAVDGMTFLVRNPLPAQGGVDPEPVEEVKLFAPGAFKKQLERAVTASDYATISGRSPKLQQASAALRWNGSWHEARVAIDPLASNRPDDTDLRRVKGYLHRFRRIGHDLAVAAAEYVPLEITLKICVLPHYLRGHVESALRDVFSNRMLADGRRGFFHPDNLSFGQGIYLSQVIAASQAVAGVQSVTVGTFQRLFEPAGDELETGVLALRPMEIARLDNDPSFPEHGKLTLNLRGGR